MSRLSPSDNLPEFFRLVAEFALFACACDFKEVGLALASEIELVPFGDFLVRLFALVSVEDKASLVDGLLGERA